MEACEPSSLSCVLPPSMNHISQEVDRNAMNSSIENDSNSSNDDDAGCSNSMNMDKGTIASTIEEDVQSHDIEQQQQQQDEEEEEKEEDENELRESLSQILVRDESPPSDPGTIATSGLLTENGLFSTNVISSSNATTDSDNNDTFIAPHTTTTTQDPNTVISTSSEDELVEEELEEEEEEEETPSLVAISPLYAEPLAAPRARTCSPAPQAMPLLLEENELLTSKSATPVGPLVTDPLLLLTLPVDPLHCIAGFVSTVDWCNLSVTSKTAYRACREVFRRVRMHGLRCAMEVVTAMERGQHADAKELSAMYLRSGVPIYPLCLGHSYHTLAWRMKAEFKRRQAPDRFDTEERSEVRESHGHFRPSNTYVEEKCLFWRSRREAPTGNHDNNAGTGNSHTDLAWMTPERRHLLVHGAVNLRPPPPPMPDVTHPPAPHHQPPPAHHHYVHLHAHNFDNFMNWVDPPPIPPVGPLVVNPPPPPPPPAHHLHHVELNAFNTDMNPAVAADAYHGLDDNAPAEGALNHALPPPRRGPPASLHHSSFPNRQHAAQAHNQHHPRPPKIQVKIHKHLYDRHVARGQSIITTTHEDSIRCSSISLSADFFHPVVLSQSRNSYHGKIANSSYGQVTPNSANSGATTVSTLSALQLLDPIHHSRHNLDGNAATPAPSTTTLHTNTQPTEQPLLREERVVEPPITLPDELHTPEAEDGDDGAHGEDALFAPEAPRPTHHRTQTPPPSLTMAPTPNLQLNSGFDDNVLGFSNATNAAASSTSSVPSQTMIEHSVMMDVLLQIYTCTSDFAEDAEDEASQSSGEDGTPPSNKVSLRARIHHLRERFAYFQRRMDAVLTADVTATHSNSPCNSSSTSPTNSNSGVLSSLTMPCVPISEVTDTFEDVLLDFWDEFLPRTAGTYYYDKHTPIPRHSCLHRFLTQPLPKAFGTVQCEIERIKSLKKSVKGRLFPTYEYRLFIRDRRVSSNFESPLPNNTKRMDTVLMTAKNRGKNHPGMAGVVVSSSNSKRGVNNYYLSLPSKVDIDRHFESVNLETAEGGRRTMSTIGNSWQKLPSCGNFELGRLQSNFIGTEFQIFSPCIVKVPKSSCSDGSGDENSKISNGGTGVGNISPNQRGNRNKSNSDNGSVSSGGRSLRRMIPNPARSITRSRSKRKSSLLLQRNSDAGLNDGNITPRSQPSEPRIKQGTMSRRGSWPTLYGSRSSRTSRRAIANSVDVCDSSTQPVMGEEENGAITYTANLLGNRPRIMDVCIPKVRGDASVSNDWRRYCEQAENGENEGGTMLSKLKILQQLIEQDPPTNNNNNDTNENNDATTPEVNNEMQDYGLQALQNRPPWWNVELGAFVLNFGGRVSVASVKNFQLCDRQDHENIMLQFGRIQGRHSFTMDFSYPLTAVQAFAIAISSLQSKISFG